MPHHRNSLVRIGKNGTLLLEDGAQLRAACLFGDGNESMPFIVRPVPGQM